MMCIKEGSIKEKKSIKEKHNPTSQCELTQSTWETFTAEVCCKDKGAANLVKATRPDVLFRFRLVFIACCYTSAHSTKMGDWGWMQKERNFVIKCILEGMDMTRNEGSKDNGMDHSSSVGQFLLHFRSAIARVIIIGSVLLDQFGNLSTASHVERKDFKDWRDLGV